MGNTDLVELDITYFYSTVLSYFQAAIQYNKIQIVSFLKRIYNPHLTLL